MTLPRVALEVAGVALSAGGLAAFVRACAVDPQSVGRRASATYVAHIDAQRRQMFLPPRGLLMASAQLSAFLALVALWAFVREGSVLFLCGASLVLPPLLVRAQLARRQKRLDDQVHGFALALANALKTTASIGDALGVTLAVSSAPLRQELGTALRQMRIGSSLEEALLAMAARARSSALDVVVSALLIGRKTGGDLPRILEQTATSLRELKRLEEMTARVTSGAKQSVLIAACITLGLALVIPRVVPGFFDPLRDTLQGQLVALQCAVVYLLAVYLGFRFTRTDI